MFEKSAETNTTSMRRFLDFLDNTPPFKHVERAALVLAGTLGMFAMADISHHELPSALFEGSIALATLGVAKLCNELGKIYLPEPVNPNGEDLWYESDGVRNQYSRSDILPPR